MASKLSWWHKGGRFISGLVIALFFLPFFGVSCQGMEVITVSGADMVGGCRPGGLATETKSGGSSESSIKVSNVDREPIAIVALLLAIAVFATAWVRTRGALIAACALAFVGFAAIGALYVVVGGKLTDSVADATKKDTGGSGAANSMAKDVMKDIDAGSRFGLWMTALGFLAMGTLTALALREKAAVAAEPAPAQPPVG
jgi:hypothetical protein